MALNINGVDHKLEIVDPFGDGNEFVLYLKQNVTDNNVSFPSIYSTALTSYADGVEAVKAALVTMNADIAEFYNTPVNDKTGRALLEELIGLITVVNGKLTLNA